LKILNGEFIVELSTLADKLRQFIRAIDINIWIGKQFALTRLTARAVSVDSYVTKMNNFIGNQPVLLK